LPTPVSVPVMNRVLPLIERSWNHRSHREATRFKPEKRGPSAYA
jgi:hypothetical protein